MSVTLAELAMKVDSRDVATGVLKLDDLTAAGAKAEVQTNKVASASDRLAAEQRKAGAALEQTVTAANDLTRRVVALKAAYDPLAASADRVNAELAEANMLFKAGAISAEEFARANTHLTAKLNGLQTAQRGAAASGKVLTQTGLNLSRQFADVGVSLAGGISPMMVLIQQGPQVADAFAMAKTQGLGFTAVLRGMTAAAAPVLAVLAPIIAAVALATAAFALFEREVDKNTKRATTFGDTWQAVVNVVGKALMDGPIGDGLKWLGETFDKVLGAIVDGTMNWLDRMVGFWGAAYVTIVKHWRNLPQVLGAIVVGAVNQIITTVEGLINASIAGINRLTAIVGWEPVAKVQLERVKQANNAVADDFEKTQQRIQANFKKSREAFGGAVVNEADRLAGLREKPKKDKAGKSAKAEIDEQTKALRAFTDQMRDAAEVADDFARSWEKFANPLNRPDVGLAVNAAESQAYADTLAILADDTDALARRTVSAAQLMADAFGNVGAALGDMALVQADYQANQAAIFAKQAQDIADHQKALSEAGNDSRKISEADRQFALKRLSTERALRDAETDRNLNSLRSAKSLFKEKSAAYKVLTGLELALQATQIAGMAIDAIATAKSIGNSILRSVQYAKEAVVNAFKSVPFPFNFAAAAAVAAAIAALGIRAMSGGGGGSSVPTAEDRQKAQGTGSILGDATAKSESIARALDLVAANTNRDLEYSNGMLRSLRSIDQNIGALTSVLARQLGIGGAFDTSDLGLGTSRKGPSDLATLLVGGPVALLLSKIPVIGGIIDSLFGTKKTTTLLDQGLNFDPQSLDAIVGGGLSGETYQDIQTQTKKKFLGVTYSNKTKTSTQTTPLGDDILAEMQRVIASLKDGVLAAAGALGVEGADAALAAFTVNLGTISFKDKTGAEIQEELNAIFGKLGDELSAAVFPAISGLQKAGEGAFETLVRVARQYQVVDLTLQSIGKTFGMVGVSSLAARESLIDLFGSLDDFVEQTQFFADNFLTEAERIAPIQAAVQKEFARLGVSGVNNIEQFKQLVLGLDLSTAAGQEMFAALLAVAPAFKKVFDYITEGSKDVEDARSALTRAYEAEASALQDTKDRFDSFAKSLRAFRQSLDTGPNALLSPEAQYIATKAAFEATASKARLGDATALGDLQNVSQAYLDASRSYYASSGRYFADLAAVKAAVEAAGDTATRTASNADQQLIALKASVAGLITVNTSVLSVRDAIIAMQAALGAQAAAAQATGTPFSPLSPTGPTATGPTPPSPVPGSGGFNAAGYLAANPDIAAAYEPYAAGTSPYQAYYDAGLSLEQFAKAHYDMAGKDEGRTGFATGGSFTVAGSGPKNFGPVDLHGGETANISRADTMAAVVSELKTANTRLASLERKLAQHGEATVASNENAGKRIERAVAKPSTERLVSGGRA